MRLLIATPLYSPDSGGPATYTKALEAGLPGRDIETVVVSFSTFRHKPKGIRHAQYFWEILRQGKQVDAILALDPVSVGLPTMLAARILRKPFFVKIVGDYAWEQGRQRFRMWLPLDEFVQTSEVPLPVKGLRFVQGIVARSAKKILVPSEYLKSIVITWGILPQKITVIYNAVPNTEIEEVPQAVTALPTPRIVSAGRLVPWKGMHGLITAMVKIRKEVPAASLVIVGEGPERKGLERFARARLGETGLVFTGALDHAEALAVYASAEVFVLNSTYEGLSHVLIEVMAEGRAIVATKAGGNPELIQHEENGLLISVGDTDALADAVLRYLQNPDMRKKYGDHARTKSTEFSATRMLDATAAFFKNEV